MKTHFKYLLYYKNSPRVQFMFFMTHKIKDFKTQFFLLLTNVQVKEWKNNFHLTFFKSS